MYGRGGWQVHAGYVPRAEPAKQRPGTVCKRTHNHGTYYTSCRTRRVSRTFCIRVLHLSAVWCVRYACVCVHYCA